MVKMGTVWDRTAEFLSDNIAAIVPIALLAFFVPASIEGNFEAAMKGASIELVLTLRLVQLAFAILSLWGSLAIVAMALDVADGGGAGRVAGRRLLPALGVSVVMLIAVMLLAVPIPLVLSANGVDLAAVAQRAKFEISPGLAGFVAVYGILLGALLVWASARLSVTTAVIVRENRALSALAQSWKLTRGFALRIVGLIVLLAIVAWVSRLAAQTVFGSIFVLIAGGGADGVSLSGVMTAIVVAAVQSAFTVLVPAFTAKLYLALAAERGLREGAGAA